MNTFPTSTAIMRNDLKRRLRRAIVEWVAAWQIPSGSVVGSFNLYEAVENAVDAEHKHVLGGEHD